jgi:VWFA-related protein
VDTSESVAPRFQAAMHEVVQLISQQAPSSDDNISVVSFAGLQPVLVCARDCRTVAAEDRLRAVKAAGVTPLFDALTYAADLVSQRQAPGVRPVLIVFSDGNDTISKASARDAVGAAMASGGLLYTIDLNDPKHVTEGSAVLQQMAAATGGRAFSLQEGAVQVLQAVFADLRASYLVTYQLPSRAVGFHSLRILPKHNLNLRFHCRSGYYYEKSSP